MKAEYPKEREAPPFVRALTQIRGQSKERGDMFVDEKPLRANSVLRDHLSEMTPL